MKIKGKNHRIRNFTIFVSLLCFLFLFTENFAIAKDKNKIFSTVVADESIYLYVKEMESVQSITAQIGTSSCNENDIFVENVSEMDIPIHTIILVDNSYSIPSNVYEKINQIMRGLVENALPNEQFKIGTFSDELNYMCNFSSDREEIFSCINNIEYKNQDTYFSDVLFEVLTQINEENDSCLTRILMISDGADDNGIGYTNAEVQKLSEESGIPVYTVGIKRKNNNTELETMFSFSRLSNAEYYLLEKESPVEGIIEDMSLNQHVLCIEIKPDSELLDGSYKNILLEIQTGSGVQKLTTSVKMPFASDRSFSDVQEEIVEESIAEKEEISEVDKERRDNQFEAMEPWMVVVMAVLLFIVALAASVGSLLLIKNKRNNSYNEHTDGSQYVMPVNEEKCEFSSEKQIYDKTVMLTSENEVNNRYVILRNVNNPEKMYKVPIEDKICIGRKNADIIINDKYVSAKHCELILKNEILYIRDTNSSNGTFYNNIKITSDVPITNEGKIRIGKSEFSVELSKE